jgi:hypothetical protein
MARFVADRSEETEEQVTTHFLFLPPVVEEGADRLLPMLAVVEAVRIPNKVVIVWLVMYYPTLPELMDAQQKMWTSREAQPHCLVAAGSKLCCFHRNMDQCTFAARN